MNMEEMLAQAQKAAETIQKQMGDAQAKLDEIEVEGTAGGRAVVVVMTCAKEVRAVTFSDEVLEQVDKDELEEMTLLAMRDAVGQAERISKEELSAVTGGLNLPGLM